jgi:triacylglycerol lipase
MMQVTALQRNRRPIAFGASAVVDYIRRENLSRVVIVAHSKGGLIGKQVMMTEESVSSMVAICTPFSGSRYAEFMLLPSLRAFRANNTALVALRANEVANARIVSVFGRFDPHIPEGSELVGAKNIQIDTGGHFRIMAHPDTIAAVLQAAGDGS